MNIIITGASGFVGINLSHYLQNRNFEILKVSLRKDNWRSFIKNDSEAIIHLAGKAHDTSNVSEPQEYFTINRDLTIQLFNEFLNSDIKDFFYFSSTKAVADTVNGILTEEVAPNPLTPYGKSKLEAEEYLLSKKLPEDKRLFIIRPCMIHGPGNKGNLTLLYNIVKKNIPWPLGAFSNQRSFLSVDNLCFLIGNILKSKKIKSGIYNFSDDKPLSTNELVYLIAKTLNKKNIIWKINKGLIVRFAKLGDKISLPLNSDRLKKLTESYIVSNDKIKNQLEIDELPVSVENGLINTIQAFINK